MASETTPADPNSLADSVQKIHLAAGSTPTNDNPWSKDLPDTDSLPPQHRLETPDPAQYDAEVTSGLGTTIPVATVGEKAAVNTAILNEFDPLASPDEQAAQKAWQNTESHPPPPPPRTPSPKSPPPPAKDEPVVSHEDPSTPTPSTSNNTLTSLTSFARSFSIPALGKSRPNSMDGAKNVPSPATISSFASQQQQHRPPAVDMASSESAVPDATSPKDKADPPFDFQKFLDQMKTKNAEPIAKYLKSFLSSFSKRSFTVKDQVKIIGDFLDFIAAKMREIDIWRNASDAEFENAMEGIEKLVMNRVYEYTFTPAVVTLIPPRPVTADDLERDRVLSQRVALFGWVESKHLDIPEGEGSQGFLMFAQQELLKINHYKAPRDKLICILNSCKVIFGLIRHLRKEEGADAFLPILIFVVLRANPEHLLSNVEFINRFRSPAKLQGESGYYLSSLMGAVSFIETMDHTSLSCISQEDFEKNVEQAIQALPPSQPQSPQLHHQEYSTPKRPAPGSPATASGPGPAFYASQAGEGSAEPLALSTPVQTLGEDARKLLQRTGDTISKPLNAISRIFNEALDNAEGKLSYLPGPFAPLELGREARQGGGYDNGGGGQESRIPPTVPTWTRPGSGSGIETQQRKSSLLGNYPGQFASSSEPSSPGRVPNTPFTGEPLPPIQTPYKPRIRRAPSPSYLQSPSSPTSPGGGYGPEDTPSRPGQHTHSSSLSLSSLPPVFRNMMQPAPQQHNLPQSMSQPIPGGGGGGLASAHVSRTPTPSLDFAGMQHQIDEAHEQAAEAAKGTLMQIFPAVDEEVIELVLEAKDGDLGKSIEALLEMSGGG